LGCSLQWLRFRLHQLKWSRRDWGNIRVFVVTASPFKVSFPNTLPAATGVVPEANGAAGVPNVSSGNDLTHYVYRS
jgi:hypothetical protein